MASSNHTLAISFDKAAMVRELALAVGSVERKTTIPILSNILMTAGGDRVSITATDLECSMHCGIPAKVGTAGTATIAAKRFLDYVRLLPDGDVSLKVSDTHWASIVAGRAKTRIAGMSAEAFPSLPPAPDDQTAVPALALARMIRRVMFAITREASRFSLQGALFEITDEEFRMVATDGHRLAYAAVAGGGRPLKAILPLKAMGEIAKIASSLSVDSEIRFGMDENHLFFRAGERTLTARKMTGNFPDYERVMPKSHKGTAVFNVADFREAMTRVKLFTDERSSAVRLKVADGEIGLEANVSETGETSEFVPAEVKGPDVTVGFNATYVLDFLAAVESDRAELRYSDASSPGIFVPFGEQAAQLGEYRVVIMPMRI